jgi:bacillithiol synthase
MSSYLNDLKKEVTDKLFDHISFPDFASGKRNDLVKELKEQNKNSGDNVLANISLLSESSTYTVITGQQLGLYGGPLYTFYKILNTVQLCKELNEEYPEKTFVPVYWFEAEDADIQEVSKLHLYKDELKKILYEFEDSNESVALKKFNKDIERLNDLIEYENEIYKENVNWLDATKLFFKKLFDEYGIIGFSSNTDTARLLAKEFWEIVLNNHSEIKRSIKEESQRLSDLGFSNQFELRDNDDFIFHHAMTGRIKLDKITKYDSTVKYSTNVILRPLLQDFLFPNIIYIGGDAELAYQQQIKTSYKYFSREAPVLFPRSHATILDSKSQRLLKKYEISNIETLAEQKAKLLESEERKKLESLFKDFNNEFNKLYDNLQELNFADLNTSQKILEGSKTRQEKGFEQLEQRIDSMLKKQNEDLLKHFSYLEAMIYPENNLQERIYPVIQFDRDLVHFAALFFEQIDLFKTENQILIL